MSVAARVRAAVSLSRGVALSSEIHRAVGVDCRSHTGCSVCQALHQEVKGGRLWRMRPGSYRLPLVPQYTDPQHRDERRPAGEF